MVAKTDLSRLIARGAKAHQAAHVVPTGQFTRRSRQVQQAIQDAKDALEWAGIELNLAPNGFWARSGHNGTHRNKYFLEVGETLTKAKAVGTEAVAEALASILENAKRGVYRAKKYKS